MKRWLFLIACASAPVVGQVSADPAPSNLTYRLEYATRDADAHHDCPSKRHDGYAADFQRHFGQRIQHLKDIHLARSGPDPTFMILTDCRGFSGSESAEDARHYKAMNEFEATLRKLELEFAGDPVNANKNRIVIGKYSRIQKSEGRSGGNLKTLPEVELNAILAGKEVSWVQEGPYSGPPFEEFFFKNGNWKRYDAGRGVQITKGRWYISNETVIVDTGTRTIKRHFYRRGRNGDMFMDGFDQNSSYKIKILIKVSNMSQS